MAFDFDQHIDRTNTHSMKWDRYKGKDVLPMWVADMDFAAPPAILEALANITAHGILGYSLPPEALTTAIVDRLRAKHQWAIKPEWIVYLPGLVPGITLACHAVGSPGDAVMTTTPVYGPFYKCPPTAERIVQRVPLKLENKRYTFDFEAIKNHISDSTKLFLLCNPYNPAGTVFTQSELEQLGDICLENGIVICSDEIHCDLVIDPTQNHLSIGSLRDTFAQNSITLLSPSKTFNIAGLGGSFAIIPNEALRKTFTDLKYTHVPMLSAYAAQAMLAAYTLCDSWHAELLTYLKRNHDYLFEHINAIEGLEMLPHAGTYLAWVRYEGHPDKNLCQNLENAGLGVSEGKAFFEGEGYFRLNFGTQFANVQKAVEILRKVC